MKTICIQLTSPLGDQPVRSFALPEAQARQTMQALALSAPGTRAPLLCLPPGWAWIVGDGRTVRFGRALPMASERERLGVMAGLDWSDLDASDL